MQDLMSALIAALESHSQNHVGAPNDLVFDILLAEDNMVNQKLAVKVSAAWICRATAATAVPAVTLATSGALARAASAFARPAVPTAFALT
jgi:hypothetical protein